MRTGRFWHEGAGALGLVYCGGSDVGAKGPLNYKDSSTHNNQQKLSYGKLSGQKPGMQRGLIAQVRQLDIGMGWTSVYPLGNKSRFS